MTLEELLENYLPWGDPQRLAFLSAPFRPKSLNPEAWTAKSNFWKNFVLQLGRRSVTFSVGEIKDSLRKREVHLYCLEEVFGQMEKEGLIVKKRIMEENMSLDQSWSSYFQSLVGGLWPKGQTRDDTYYICPQNLNDITSSFAAKLKSHPNRIRLTNDSLALDLSLVQGVFESDMKFKTSDFDFFLKHLTSKADIEVWETFGKSHLVIVEDVSDVPLAKIQIFVCELEKLIESKERDAKLIREEAKRKVSEGSRISAKQLLKKVKRIQTQVHKHVQVLDNLEALVSQLEESDYDKDAVKVYEIASKALKDNVKSQDINDIEELLNELEDNLEQNEEITDLLSGLSLNQTSGAAELEKELEQLLNEDTPDSIQAPDVPTEDPKEESVPPTKMKTSMMA